MPLDRASDFHTTSTLGPKRSKTPEGFLVCHDVALARTGFQRYAAHEIQDPAASPPPGGWYNVERTEDEVFTPASIASWNGKPVTNDHPPEGMLSPDTAHLFQVGTVLNPRRGEGDQGHLILADLLVSGAQAIADIEAGKREVSGGYNCDYFEVSPGHLQQRNILGNHVALVDEGRCGDVCAIQDHATRSPLYEAEAAYRKQLRTRRFEMSKLSDLLTTAFKARDDKQFAKGLAVLDALDAEAPPVSENKEGTSVHLHLGSPSIPEPAKEDPKDAMPPWFAEHAKASTDRWAKDDEWRSGIDGWRKGVDEFMKGGKNDAAGNHEIEGELELEAPPGTALNDAKGATDSRFLADSFQETCEGAEILAPGIRLPTLDRAAAPGVTFKAVCGLRRQALDQAMASAATRPLVEQLTGGRPIDTKTASCRDVRSVFRGVVALRKQANRDKSAVVSGGVVVNAEARNVANGGPRTLAELNAMNAKHYEDKGKRLAAR